MLKGQRVKRKPTMRRAHFALIAETLREYGAAPSLVETFVLALRGTNPDFDAGRFREACRSRPVTNGNKS